MSLRLACRVAYSRRYLSSNLFISDRNTKVRPILTPTPDLSKKFEDLEKLQVNLRARRNDTDAVGLKELWEFYSTLNGNRETLENRRKEIAQQIKDIKRDDKDCESETEKLKLHGRLVREDLKKLMDVFWNVEERMMLHCLELPNDLNERTPLQTCQVIHQKTNGIEPEVDHLTSGGNLIDYRGPDSYYLHGSAAIFDLALTYYFLKGLKALDFKTMVPPDFAHSAVVEGCGANVEKVIGLEPMKEQFNLVGGASLFPFCSYYAKRATPFSLLPGKHVSGGKRYIQTEGKGLLGAWQKTCVDFFSISDSYDSDEILDQMRNQLNLLYTELGWDFQVSLVSAPKLKPWESLRVSYQMPALDGWVEVGSISMAGTFLSERLSMKIEDKGRNKHFGHVVSGTAVNVTAVLACLLEQKSPLLPTALKPHTFGVNI